MNYFLPCVRRFFHTSAQAAKVPLSKPRGIRSARIRNRIVSILHYARAIPPKPPVIHPRTKETIVDYKTCHTCGRRFQLRPRGKKFELDKRKIYCHHHCQISRPTEFDRWLEHKIIKFLYRRKKRNKDSAFSTDIIEAVIRRDKEGMWGVAEPRHLIERIRQAARRLVGIPGRSGEKWRVLAMEQVSGGDTENPVWKQLRFAPDRGPIFLRLVKADDPQIDVEFSEEVNESTPRVNESDQGFRRNAMKELPEWKGRFWLDVSGRLRSLAVEERRRAARLHALEAKRKEREEIKKRAPERRLAGPFYSMQGRHRQRDWEYMKARKVKWAKLLEENKDTIDILAAERNKEFGL